MRRGLYIIASLQILRCQHANFPAAQSAWQKQWGAKGEQEEARDVGFSCDQWGRENRFVIYGSEGGSMVEQGVVPEDPVWAVLMSLIVFFSILFCFAKKIELIPLEL